MILLELGIQHDRPVSRDSSRAEENCEEEEEVALLLHSACYSVVVKLIPIASRSEFVQFGISNEQVERNTLVVFPLVKLSSSSSSSSRGQVDPLLDLDHLIGLCFGSLELSSKLPIVACG